MKIPPRDRPALPSPSSRSAPCSSSWPRPPLPSTERGFKPVADAARWLLAIGERMRESVEGENGRTRARRWSYARLDYEIVR